MFELTSDSQAIARCYAAPGSEAVTCRCWNYDEPCGSPVKYIVGSKRNRFPLPVCGRCVKDFRRPEFTVIGLPNDQAQRSLAESDAGRKGNDGTT